MKITVTDVVQSFGLNPLLGKVVTSICLKEGLPEALSLLAQEIEHQKSVQNDTKKEDADKINPQHYKGAGFQVIDVIETFDLGFCLGNTLKYVCRYQNKNGLEDLHKGAWYLDRHISHG